ncbi:MAG: EXLDI protein [Propionibacteriaceae bacterium]|jgi:hypothetical protein|nr:EXLDI protein [Propionibacteriaceae bacterium]
MPQRTIYVSESAQELFDRAAQEAGGLSRAITAALRDYLAKAELSKEGMETVDLTIDEDGSHRKVRFSGRRLLRLEREVEGRLHIQTVYATKRGQFALHQRKHSHPKTWGKNSDRLWEDPRTWNSEFWFRTEKTLDVFPTLDDLRRQDPELADRVEAAMKHPALEELDI